MTGPMAPAAPVRIHVQNLIADGMTQAAICRAAAVTSAYLSALLYGNYDEARTPMQHTGAHVAARLLAVRNEPSAPKERPEVPCAPGDRFTPLGYRVGRCDYCGQVAPVQVRAGALVMYSHPRPEPGLQDLDGLPAATPGNPDCGSTKGVGRHRREGSDLCGPCRNVQRGYDAGYKAAMTRAARDAKAAIPEPLAEAMVRACRAIAFREPVGRARRLAVQVVRIADAELCDDEGRRAA